MRKTVLGLAAASLLSFGMSQSGGGQSGGTDSGGMQSGGAASEPGVAAQSQTGTSLIFVEARNPGGYIATPEGNTLYTLVDSSREEVLPCEADCLAAWPPYTGEATVDADTGLDPSLVGTTEAADGSTQVTYNGYPLYLFTQDTQPGALEGQGVEAFGGFWYIVQDSGIPLKGDPITGE